MIEFVIEESSDLDVIGEHFYYLDIIELGRYQGDLLIDDEKILSAHLKLEVTENSLNCSNNPSVEYFHVNGKRVSGTAVLKQQDRIKIGDSVIKIQSFMLNPNLSDRLIDENLEHIIREDGDLNKLLEIFEADLKSIDKALK